VGALNEVVMSYWKEQSQFESHDKWDNWTFQTIKASKAPPNVVEIATAFSVSVIAGLVMAPLIF